jgi:RNA exonuclease NGL2
MILVKPERFEVISERTVYYDEEDIRTGSPEGMDLADKATIWRRGTSRKTGNIALLVGVRDKRDPEKGLVVGTTHLFWHGA